MTITVVQNRTSDMNLSSFLIVKGLGLDRKFLLVDLKLDSQIEIMYFPRTKFKINYLER